MGWNDPDLYSQPEKFGLTPVGELNDPEANWSFDTFVVWKHEDGKIYWANDSGCSCPSPFEDYTSLDRANTVVSMHDFIDAVKEYFNSIAPYTSDYNHRTHWDSEILPYKFQVLKIDALELIQKVREA